MQIFVPMQNLITSYILQTKECRLRDIGRFRINDISAETDIANKQIIPPSIEISFTSGEDKISDGLVKYVADKKKIPIPEALESLKNWCVDAKTQLKNGGEILLQPLGILKKGPSGNLFIQNNSFINFFEPVAAERVIHQNSEHAMLVGDKETTSSKMNNYFKPEEITGRKVVVVANLAPRKMRGISSNGMILMAEDTEGKLHFVNNETDVAPGSTVA